MTNLPWNEDAELALLGSILLDKSLAYNVFPVIKEEYFHSSNNRVVYQGMQDLLSAGEPVDFVTLSNQIEKSGKLDLIGGPSYLVKLMQSSPESLHIEHYANIVRDYYKLRILVITANQISTKAQKSDLQNVNLLLEEFSQSLYGIFQAGQEKSTSNAGFLMEEFYKDFEYRYNNPGGLEISTGFLELDAVLNGYNPGDLVIIAGRPSQGKTALAMSSMLSLGLEQVPCVLFPREMSRLQTSQRFVSMLSHVGLSKVRTGRGLSEKDLQDMNTAIKTIERTSILVDNDFGDINQISSAIRMYQSRYSTKVVFIDYLQLIPMYSDDLTNEIGNATRTLKTLARSLNITVVLLSQLNRGVESRSGGRPRASDLRQSGRIEEDADVVILLHRDEEVPEDAEIIIAKNRQGPTGSVNLLFQPEVTLFSGRRI